MCVNWKIFIKRLALSASDQGVINEADLRMVPEFDQLPNASLSADVNLNSQHQISRKLNCMSGKKREPAHCRCNERLDQYQQLIDEAGGNVAEVSPDGTFSLLPALPTF